MLEKYRENTLSSKGYTFFLVSFKTDCCLYKFEVYKILCKESYLDGTYLHAAILFHLPFCVFFFYLSMYLSVSKKFHN